jgi:hypothetical protein
MPRPPCANPVGMGRHTHWYRSAMRVLPFIAALAFMASLFLAYVGSPAAAAKPQAGREKIIAIQPDGTIVTSQSGKVVEVDKTTLAPDRPHTPASHRPRLARRGAIDGSPKGRPIRPVADSIPPSRTDAIVPHSLRTPESVSPPSPRLTWKHAVSIVLLYTALVVLFFCYLMLLAGAFSVSIAWGALVLVLPVLGGLIFAAGHWAQARTACLVMVLVVVPMFVASFLLFA